MITSSDMIKLTAATALLASRTAAHSLSDLSCRYNGGTVRDNVNGTRPMRGGRDPNIYILFDEAKKEFSWQNSTYKSFKGDCNAENQRLKNCYVSFDRRTITAQFEDRQNQRFELDRISGKMVSKFRQGRNHYTYNYSCRLMTKRAF